VRARGCTEGERPCDRSEPPEHSEPPRSPRSCWSAGRAAPPAGSPAVSGNGYELIDSQGETAGRFPNGCDVANRDGNSHFLMSEDGFLYGGDLAAGQTEGPVDLCFQVTDGAQNSPVKLVWAPNGDTSAVVSTELPAASVPAGLPAPPTPVPTYLSQDGTNGGPAPTGTPPGQTFIASDNNPGGSGGAQISGTASLPAG
jgi:hypothetical protein